MQSELLPQRMTPHQTSDLIDVAGSLGVGIALIANRTKAEERLRDRPRLLAFVKLGGPVMIGVAIVLGVRLWLAGP